MALLGNAFGLALAAKWQPRYWKESNEEDFPYPPEAFIEAIRMLQESLQKVSDSQALIFNMG